MHLSALSVARRVLLADTDQTWTRSIAGILRSNGYEVVLTPYGSEVRRRLDGEDFGAVISDWDLGGLELLAHIRGNSQTGYTYVIITSRDGDAMQRGMAAGADDFLIKPVDAGLLLARMRVAERIGIMREAIAHKNEELSAANRQLAEINERIGRELSAAARVQQSLLPSSGFRAPGMQVAWRLRPGRGVAGDILNCLRLDEQHVAFYLLDVSGHGVSAALLSVQVARMMSPMMSKVELLKQRLDHPPWYRVVEPGAVVRRLNEVFRSNDGPSQYFTLAYGVLHLQTGRLRFATGGYPSPIIEPASGDPRLLSCPSHPVGLFEDADLFEHATVLEIGDRVWFYSDGVTCASDAHWRSLGEERLQAYIAARPGAHLQASVDGVIDAVENWCLPGEPNDDCALLAIERDEAGR